MKNQTGIFYAFFLFVFVAILTIWGSIAYVGYRIATDPGVIGRSAGTIVKEFKETSK